MVSGTPCRRKSGGTERTQERVVEGGVLIVDVSRTRKDRVMGSDS